MNLRLLFGVAVLAVLYPLQAEDAILDGLVVEFRSKAKDSGHADFRLQRRVALFVEKGTSPTPFLSPGPFQATWRGVLRLEKRERLYFSFAGFGKAILLINGEEVLHAEGEDLSTLESERLRLNGGNHPIEIRFTSADSGAGRLRFYWKGRDFALETIPPKSFGHNSTQSTAEPFLHSTQIREGRLLVASHGCFRCHQPAKAFDPRTAMSEALATGPSLLGIGSRLKEAWMADWILNPKKFRHTARMPELVDTPEEARHLARFLSTLKIPLPKDLKPATVGDLNRGASLFSSSGCISCHLVKKEKPGQDSDRISLVGMDRKFLPGALSQFLQSPGQHFSWTRMPDFKLSPQEASDLALFLRELTDNSTALVSDLGDEEKGRALFAQRGCATCHQAPIENSLQAPPFSALANNAQKGCVADVTGSPRFGFSPDRQTAIIQFLKKGQNAVHRMVPHEFANRQFNELRCFACHTRDETESLWNVYTEELDAWLPKASRVEVEKENPGLAHPSNRIPPSLTYAGEKLRADWTRSLLDGTIKKKSRPWMPARMPAFSAHAKKLAEGLAHSCGLAFEEKPVVAKEELPKMAQAGARMASILCITCHGIGARAPTAVFEGQGINLLDSRDRMRREHYLRWMLNPYRINPATIMPKFADDEGRSGLIDLLDGDARRQFDAVWIYLNSFPPEKR